MVVSSNQPTQNSGYGHPENYVQFQQNQLKLSVNDNIKADLENFRFKEMVDSFLSPQQMDWVDELLQCVQGYNEINQELIRIYESEIIKENLQIEADNLRLVEELQKDFPQASREYLEIQYKLQEKPLVMIEKDVAICLTPTVHRVWAEAKNICQLAKSRAGIAVRTASTQKLIHEQQSVNKEILEEQKRGITGSVAWKKEPQSENDLYG